ncbi:MAG: hypothetical protein ABEI39_05475 [Halobacteriales archaeon]
MAADSRATTRDGSRPKSVLICPTCGHESRPAGDWLARRRDTVDGEKLALVCPGCDADITYRPLEEATTDCCRATVP